MKRLYYRLGIDFWRMWMCLCHAKKLWTNPFDRLPLTGIGCEIGVYSGTHAARLLKRHKHIILHLVDPYIPYGDLVDLTLAEETAHRRLSKYNERIIWHKKTIQEIVLSKLDFAYIDGDHKYPSVWSDIDTLWPIISCCGYLGGHDFGNYPGVTKAVTEFAVKNSLDLHVENYDWWVKKC